MAHLKLYGALAHTHRVCIASISSQHYPPGIATFRIYSQFAARSCQFSPFCWRAIVSCIVLSRTGQFRVLHNWAACASQADSTCAAQSLSAVRCIPSAHSSGLHALPHSQSTAALTSEDPVAVSVPSSFWPEAEALHQQLMHQHESVPPPMHQ